MTTTQAANSNRSLRRFAGTILLGAAFLLIQPTQVFGIAGLEGTFEFGLDAPWRIEPSKKADGTLEYGAIPIQITIHGARHTPLDNIIYPLGPEFTGLALPENVVSLGNFFSVRVKELSPTETRTVEFPLRSLHEVEFTTGDWPWPTGSAPQPFHKVCRIWKGEDPEPFRLISRTSEWHATLFYVPSNKTPGTSIALQIEVLLTRENWPPAPLKGTVKLGGTISVPVTVPFDFSPFITLRNYARVLLAPTPLPRFDKRWLYGDFHYHSQGTDNEGEAGYNYRGVIRAMGAMGLDFVFATDHASSSEQIIDADLPRVSKIPEIAHSQGDKLTESNVRSRGGVLRDMDANRYAFNHGLIYGANGVNNEAAMVHKPQNYRSYGVVPQLFLGCEVDAVPEVKASTVRSNTFRSLSTGEVTVKIPYGNGLTFNLGDLASPLSTTDPRQTLLDLGGNDSFLVRDFQSLESFQFYGREHLVYFPNTSSLFVGNETTFVPSNTSRFGGATRRLDSSFFPDGTTGVPPLLPEFERKGVVFVAHHLNASKGGRGPDGLPWTTDHMLLKAFRSPAVLGMEFWNEDTHFRTRVCSHDFCRDGADGSTYLGAELGYERNEKLEADSNNFFEDLAIGFVNALGGDLLPKEFHNVALPLEEVRHGFVSGGPSGGLFELNPFDVRTGAWQENAAGNLSTLRHGAFDWDTMNLRGLNFEANANLTWLKKGEPRRMFMGGGSDAHGDLNYRRAGYFLGTDDANDTAIGKPRNLVFAGEPEGEVVYTELPTFELKDPVQDPVFPTVTPTQPVRVTRQSIRLAPTQPLAADSVTSVTASATSITAPVTATVTASATSITAPITAVTSPVTTVTAPVTSSIIGGQIGHFPNGVDIRAHSHAQIVRALRSGQFCVTDGPAIRIAIDVNGNNQIDDGDIQMGGIHSINPRTLLTQPLVHGQKVTLLTEVVSTPEFGGILSMDVYVGVHPEPATSRTTVPREPRMYAPLGHGPGGPTPGAAFSYQSNGRNYVRRKDNYWASDLLGDTVSWRQVPGDPLKNTRTLVTTLDLDKYEAGQGLLAERFFVRAFVRTGGVLNGAGVGGLAFSNPIWIRRNESNVQLIAEPISGGVISRTSLDESSENGPAVQAARNADGQMVITFTGVCMFTPSLGQPFQDLTDAVSPYVVPTDKQAGFFRARSDRGVMSNK